MMGLRIVVRPWPSREIRWHRQRRIHKKWRKQRGPRRLYLKVNPRESLHDPARGVLYCYPPMAAAVAQALREIVEAERVP